jgi:ribonuclease HII
MKYFIGIDEVGRGALAGPLIVCACALPQNFKIKNKNLGKLYDSKKLTALKRNLWFNYLNKEKQIKLSFYKISPKLIDKINIFQASNLAAFKSLEKLIKKEKINLKKSKIFLDGGLYLKSADFQKSNFKNAKTIIKGDEKINCIKLASIAAKVKRDKLMRKLSKKYPQYFFEQNKGYGTKIHFTAIKKYGISPLHRLTFI